MTVERETIVGSVMEGETLPEVSWERVVDAEFQDCRFVGADLSESQLGNSRFVECRFERCDLSLWKLVDSVIGGCQFEDCRMLGIDWTLAVWPTVPLHEPNTFVRCDLSMGTFADLVLGAITFDECRLREVSFRGASMTGARLKGSDCLGADFLEADLTEANLVDAKDLFVDPRSTRMQGSTVDAISGLAILESLGINLAANAEEESHRQP